MIKTLHFLLENLKKTFSGEGRSPRQDPTAIERMGGGVENLAGTQSTTLPPSTGTLIYSHQIIA